MYNVTGDKMIIKKLFKFLLKIVLSCIFIIFSINTYMILDSNNKMVDIDSIDTLEDIDAIIVLGCGLKTIETPSDMLAERLDKGIELYHKGVSNRLLMSGDHSGDYHDEVRVMKKYAIENHVPSENIYLDHAGYSTYESMYRAKDIFKAKNIVIVTQEYHLYRAVYIANTLGLNAYGVSSNLNPFSGDLTLDLREMLARTKDFIYTIVKPEPTILGEVMPVRSINGDLTNNID